MRHPHRLFALIAVGIGVAVLLWGMHRIESAPPEGRYEGVFSGKDWMDFRESGNVTVNLTEGKEPKVFRWTYQTPREVADALEEFRLRIISEDLERTKILEDALASDPDTKHKDDLLKLIQQNRSSAEDAKSKSHLSWLFGDHSKDLKKVIVIWNEEGKVHTALRKRKDSVHLPNETGLYHKE